MVDNHFPAPDRAFIDDISNANKPKSAKKRKNSSNRGRHLGSKKSRIAYIKGSDSEDDTETDASDDSDDTSSMNASSNSSGMH